MLPTSLSEYVFLLICFELDVPDILSFRQVCREFCEATKAKTLWLTVLATFAASDGHVLPPYSRNPKTLDSIALEALVRRVACLKRKWSRNNICPVDVWRLNLCQSITWLRLVNGSWLFVASSDNHVSKISCWDLSLVFQGYTEPIAEAYLSGQVKTAQVQVQDTGVVLALGLGPNSPSVQIITLRQDSGSHYFAELCHVEGSSHVLMLQGHLVGCATRWPMRYNLPPQAGSDSPETRVGLLLLAITQRYTDRQIQSAPHLLISWSDLIVVVRHNSLDLYTQPSPASDPRLINSVPTQAIWEVVVLGELTPTSSPLKLLVLSPRGLEIYTLEYDVVLDAHATCTPHLLAASPHERCIVPPWYHLHLNGTGTRALWLAVGDPTAAFVQYPCVCSMSIPSSPSGLENTLVLQWTNDLQQDPALWAFPCLDFDEALGFTVIGNCFGELAVYDCVGHDPINACGLAVDFTDQLTSFPPLSLDPIPLRLHLTPPPPFGNVRPDQTLVSHWSQDNLGLDPIWRTNWFSGNYWRWESWQGNPGDIARLIVNAYGFPANVVPQAYGSTPYDGDVYVLFRSGGRYFIYMSDEFNSLKSLPTTPPVSLEYLFPGSPGGQRQPCMRPTAYTSQAIDPDHCILKIRVSSGYVFLYFGTI
ncbi:hypothetical protein DFH06DRAFT_1152737 [Mycena polygramma]|nr:hypothetical protein DFH06DRAFT_1152737 [Mycena polygramma]